MEDNGVFDEYYNKRTNDIDDRDNVPIITFRNLTVLTAEEKSWWRRKSQQSRTTILNNVSGCIRRGEFAAVIGPSGAGKTTFLVSLAGKCTLPSFGMVLVNGRNVRETEIVQILPQFDVFMDGLSVVEHLVFMAEMKLGSCKEEVNKMKLNHLMDELKLKAHSNTLISALSGGERKILTLATSLLSDPQILICDEPTTGLDSYNALLVVGILKKIAMSGKIVICSVHQPSCDLFHEFNSLLLMSDGKLLFHGTQKDCNDLFESISLHCPLNYNPAEFYIRAVSTNIEGSTVDRILACYNNRLEETCPSILPQGKWNVKRRNWFKQVHLLMWRSSLTLKRDLKNHIIQLILSVIISALVLSTCYIGISGTTQKGVQDLRGFLWLVTSEVLFAQSYNALYVFAVEITLFKREVGVYSCSAYFVSRFLSFLPRCVIWPITLVSVATLAVDLPRRVVTAIEFMAALIVGATAAMAYGLGMGAVFTTTGIMGDVMPCADLPLFLMSGAFLRLSSIPAWLYPVKFVSHFFYTMDAMSNIYWSQIDYIDCSENVTSICHKDGASVLLETGYSTSNFVLLDGIGLLCIILLWSVIGYCGLKREQRKGYVY